MRSFAARRLAALAALSLLGTGARAKIIDGTVKLSSQETEQYMGKFSFSPYVRSHISGTFHVDSGQYFDQHPHDLELCLYEEAQWKKFQHAMKTGSLCIDRKKLASWSTGRIQPTFKAGGTPRRDFSFDSTLTAPSSRAHYWFAVLMDCYLEEYDAHPPPMHFNMTFLNGHSHLPADETGMISINLVGLLAMGLYGAYFFGSALARMKKMGQVHLITLIFLLAYALQWVSLLCELLHLRRFAYDGKGLRWRHTLFALDFLAGLTQSVSELVLSVLLIALAFGWTLGLESQEPLDGLGGKLLAGLHRPATLLRGLRSPTVMLLCGVGGAQFLLLCWGRSREEDFTNFHDFEHLPGMVLLGIRLALGGLFLGALRRSRAVERQREVLAFLERLAWFGSTWFLCLPALVIVALVLPPYRRHQLVAGGSVVVQAIALALLSLLFAEGSQYYKMSSLAHMGQQLPAFGGRAGPKLAVD